MASNCVTVDVKFLRRHKSLRHLSCLSLNKRKALLSSSAEDRQQVYRLQKADGKARELMGQNRKKSSTRCKGERRKSKRQGRGKCGAIMADVDAAWDAIHWEGGAIMADVDTAWDAIHWEGGSNGYSGSYCDGLYSCYCGCDDYSECYSESYSECDSECYSAFVDECFLEYLLWQIDRPQHNWQRLVESLFWEIDRPQRNWQRWQRVVELASPLLRQERTTKLLHDIFLPTYAFKNLCEQFLINHGGSILKALFPFWGAAVSLHPVPLNPAVQSRFLAARHELCTLQPAFHGTDVANFTSIFSHGLLIPGTSHGICVANGSAHGIGIYTAKLSAVSLSLGFTRGVQKLLVCGVLDDTLAFNEAQQMGQFAVSAKSSNVLNVGNAMVVFDSAMVVPLFVAEPGPD